eukprot:scaffold58913_cov24-Tisochrysis_lutea.AAC.1
MGHYQHALGQITLSKDIAALPSAQAHDDEQKCVVGDVVKITSAGRFTYGCEMENDPTRRRKLSKHKSYNVAQVLLATPSYNPEQAAKDVQ